MTKEQIIEQIEKSFSEYQGVNEAIDDAAFYIEAAFNKFKQPPLSDEELSKLASDMFDKGDIDNTTSFKLGYKLAINHRPNEWVRVEDRLPELRQDVLVFMSYGKIDCCYYDGESWRQSLRPQHSNGDVTHWQPLPTKPQ